MFLSYDVYAGAVRNATVDDKSMAVIYLRMGRSTVLHFNEKPAKIVAGNQNYVNIEFTGDDVTLQPLGPIESNLFVYGEYHRYGFLLRVNSGDAYDDLVNVRWKSSSLYELEGYGEKKASEEVRQAPTAPSKGMKSRLGKILEVNLLSAKLASSMDIHLVDLEIKNISKEEISLDTLKIKLSRRGHEIAQKQTVFEKTKLKPDEITKLRLVVEKQKKESFTAQFELSKKTLKMVVPSSWL